MRTTYMAKPNEVERKWYIVDAEARRLAVWQSDCGSDPRQTSRPDCENCEIPRACNRKRGSRHAS